MLIVSDRMSVHKEKYSLKFDFARCDTLFSLEKDGRLLSDYGLDRSMDAVKLVLSGGKFQTESELMG